jgi:hypothetical protein
MVVPWRVWNSAFAYAIPVFLLGTTPYLFRRTQVIL